MINATLGNQSLLPYVFLNHFTAYQLAVGTLLGLITGGFALIKSTQMFAKGNRYFLFACVGNWPFSWMIEDFTYFLFNPLDALSASHWSTWFLGGVYAYSPWMPGQPKPEFFIPTWYFLVFFWFIGCNWYAHRCTVYDNLLKDQVAQQLLAPKPTPDVLKSTPSVKEEHARPESPTRVPATVQAPEPPPPTKTPVTPAPTPPVVVPERTTKVRGNDAEAALAKLRQRWLKEHDNQ